ncbi:MAG: alginate export family protein [Sulfuriferula sp.]
MNAKSNRRVLRSIFGAALIVSGNMDAHADFLSDALDGGTADFQLRPRYELVQQTGKPNDANAFTMRTLMGYSLKPQGDFGAMVQFINVSNLGAEDYNSTANGKLAYPVVADPARTAVNQAFVSYTGIPDTKAKLGRQIIVLDNSRFVGNVDFRQNMQTFDGVTAVNTSLPNTTLLASHIIHTNASYANYEVPVGSNLQPVNIDLLHADYALAKGADLVAYDYFYQDLSVPTNAISNISSRTAGLRLAGKTPMIGQTKLLYTAEYAQQDSYGGSRSGIDAKYMHFGGGLDFGSIYARVDYELLGSNSNGTYGLQTPLATKHAFNGWADMFLVTPVTGLQDIYATLGGNIAKLHLLSSYHDFHADYNSVHFGDEWDMSAAYPLDKHFLVSVIYATYRASDGAGGNFPGTLVPNVNTQKAWLTLAYNY